jgi:hypothetical protein
MESRRNTGRRRVVRASLAVASAAVGLALILVAGGYAAVGAGPEASLLAIVIVGLLLLVPSLFGVLSALDRFSRRTARWGARRQAAVTVALYAATALVIVIFMATSH